MTPPVTAPTAKNHSAEAHRQEERGRRNLLLQCRRCGAKGTLYQDTGVKALAVKEGQQEAVNEAWGRYRQAEQRGHMADAEKWLRTVRDLRRGKPFWVHIDCGGRCDPFDLAGAPSSRYDAGAYRDFPGLTLEDGTVARCDACGYRITWRQLWEASGKVERRARRVARLAVGSTHGGCGGVFCA